MPDIGEHYRTASEEGESRVYRVVGTGAEVVLLCVTDADGRRVHSGELTRVDPETLSEAYEPADDPDAGIDPLAALREAIQGVYWSVRRFL